MDNELFLQIGSGLGSATALFTWPKLYAQAVSTRLKTKGLRTKHWDRLLEGEYWRTVLPIALEDAFAEAHGFSLSDREIRFSLGRSNTRLLLRDLRQCKGMVRVNESQSGFVSAMGGAWLSFRSKSILTFILGYVPFGALFVFSSSIAARTNAQVQISLLVATFLIMMMGVFATGWLEAAHRVVKDLDHRYPAWRGYPSLTESEIPVRTSIAPAAANDAV